jgi:alanine-glyoxylate transaminase/serine-glyoxylate transaminase/serine-pyruvate transaminase
MRTPYWDWTAREGPEHYQKYCGTPPEHLLYGLRQSLDMLFEEGLEAAFERHRLLAEAVRRAVEEWSKGQAFDLNVPEPAERANSVTTVLMRNGRDPAPLLEFCEKKCGVVVGVGIGELTGKAIRIAHMGHVNAPMVLGTLGVVETGLQALDIPHGKGGVQAAIDWLGRSVAP